MSTTSSYRQDGFHPNLPSRANSMASDLSDYTHMPVPIRRRSLMTPGVATRLEDPRHSQPVRGRLHKEPPVRRMSAAPAPLSNSGFFTKIKRSQTLPSSTEHEPPCFYDTSELMPREKPEELRNRLKPIENLTFRRSIETQRVDTPNEMGHIGAFKLGSLRVMNGEVNHTPATPRNLETEREVDYFHLLRAQMPQGHQTQSDPTIPTLQAHSTTGPAELSGESPQRSVNLVRKGFSFEKERSPIGIGFDDNKITEIRAPPRSTSEFAESYRLELDFTTPFSDYDLLTQSPNEVRFTKKDLIGDEDLSDPPAPPELCQSRAIGNGRRKGDELFMPAGLLTAQHSKPNVRALAAASESGSRKTGSGYSSHASLKSLKPTKRTMDSAPTVPEKTAPEQPMKSYLAHSKSVRSQDSTCSGRVAAVVMSPFPAEPLVPLVPPEEAPPAPPKFGSAPEDFQIMEEATPKPISKVEDLTRKPVATSIVSSASPHPTMAPPPVPTMPAPMPPTAHATPASQPANMNAAANVKVPSTRPPVHKPFSVPVPPQNTGTLSESESEREPIKVVRYTSVRAGERPSLTLVQRRKSTANVLHKATGRPPSRPPMATTNRPRTGSFRLGRHNRSSSEDSLASIKNFLSRSRTNSVETREQAPVTVQHVGDLQPESIPAVPTNFAQGLTERAKSGLCSSTGMRWGAHNRNLEQANSNSKDEKDNIVPTSEVAKALRRKSLPASTLTARAIAMSSYYGPDSDLEKAKQDRRRRSVDGRSIRSTHSNKSNGSRECQEGVRKGFEEEITNVEAIAGALGKTPYDIALDDTRRQPEQNSNSSSDSSVSTVRPKSSIDLIRGRNGPRRDQSGRIIGMDEASASQFARNRSQIRAMAVERRESLMALQGQANIISHTSQDQNEFEPKVGNSSFAKQLAAQAGNNVGVGGLKKRPVSLSDVPPMPALNVDEIKNKMRAKGKMPGVAPASDKPAVSSSKGVRKRNSGRGRHSMFGIKRESSTQLEGVEGGVYKFATAPPIGQPTDSSASSVSGSEVSNTTPQSNLESATSVSSNGSENGTCNAIAHTKTKVVALVPGSVAPVAPAGEGIDGILDAVLAPLSSANPSVPASQSITSSYNPYQSSGLTSPFGTRFPPPVSAASPANFTITSSLSPAGSTASSTTGYATPPQRPRLQSALSSRSSNGSSPSSFHTANSGSPQKKVGFDVSPATVMTPSMAPKWQGPSPKELAEMAMAAKSGEKGKGAARSQSALDSRDIDKRVGKGVDVTRPISEQAVRPKDEKRRNFGLGLGGSKLKQSVEV